MYLRSANVSDHFDRHVWVEIVLEEKLDDGGEARNQKLRRAEHVQYAVELAGAASESCLPDEKFSNLRPYFDWYLPVNRFRYLDLDSETQSSSPVQQTKCISCLRSLYLQHTVQHVTYVFSTANRGQRSRSCPKSRANYYGTA